MKRTSLLAGAFAFLLATGTAPAFAATPTFTDIKGHWAERDILDMAQTGIVSGYPDGTFHPDDPVSVDEFVVMALNSVSEIQSNGQRDFANWWWDKLLPFKLEHMLTIHPYTGFKFQTGEDYWSQRYMVQAMFMQMLNSQEPSRVPLKRRYAATIMLSLLYYIEDQLDGNYVKMAYGTFPDVNQQTKAVFSIHEAYVKGLMSGYPEGTFRPDQTLTRAEALALLKRMNDPSKRTPHLPDVAQVPHAEVPYQNGSTMIVFENQDIYQDYQSLLQASKLTQGICYQEDMKFYCFDNQTDRNRLSQLKYRYWDLDPFHPLLVYIPSYDPTSIEMFISQKTNALSKHEDTLNSVLTSLFGEEKQAARAKIDENLTRLRKAEPVDETFTLNGRTVKIMTETNSKTGHNVGISLSITR